MGNPTAPGKRDDACAMLGRSRADALKKRGVILRKPKRLEGSRGMADDRKKCLFALSNAAGFFESLRLPQNDLGLASF